MFIIALVLTGVCALIGLNEAGHKRALTIPEGFAGYHIVVAGTVVRVLQKGSGPDVLLIHGCPGSLEDWEPVADRLATHFRVTVYDRPGHGYSGANRDQYSYDYNARVAIELIDALRLKRVLVAGHSYGGAVALAMALKKPNAVRAFIIVDSAAYKLAEPPSAFYRTLSMPYVGPGLARLLGPVFGPAKIRSALSAAYKSGIAPESFVTDRTRLWSQPEALVSTARENMQATRELGEMGRRYPSIKYNMFIVAEADNAGRRSAAVKLNKELPHSRLFLLAGTGHYIQFEKPAELTKIIEMASAASTRESE